MVETPGDVVGILLAAGAGRRMGQPKALTTSADGVPWVTRAASTLLAAGCHPVLVVLGAGADQARGLVPGSARVVMAYDWAEGMGASLRAGLTAAQRQSPRAVAALVMLVDTPGIGIAVAQRILPLAEPGVLVRAAYDGTPGHPVLIGQEHWAGVIGSAQGDEGARGYLAGRAVTTVECADIGSGDDADTPQDVAGLEGMPRSGG